MSGEGKRLDYTDPGVSIPQSVIDTHTGPSRLYDVGVTLRVRHFTAQSHTPLTQAIN